MALLNGFYRLPQTFGIKKKRCNFYTLTLPSSRPYGRFAGPLPLPLGEGVKAASRFLNKNKYSVTMSLSLLFNMITALAFVLGLMGLLYLIMKRLGLAGQIGLKTQSLTQRLRVIETLPLTAQHRAIILRMDDTDHLVIIGPNGQSVGITKVPHHDSSTPL